MNKKNRLTFRIITIGIAVVSLSILVTACALAQRPADINGNALGAGADEEADVPMLSNNEEIPEGYVVNASGELVSIEEIRERIALEAVDETEIKTPEDVAAMNEFAEYSSGIQQFLNTIDMETADILFKYTGITIEPTPSEFSEIWANIRTMLEFLEEYTISYEEFDTVFRYFLRRDDIIHIYNPELLLEMETVLQPLFEYHNYVYIPNGTE